MKGSTLNPATETFGQARQGSVAAIIQVLNERLADVGIRTRAMVADGMLQLLCEAETPDKLEKAPTVERVRSELEDISPLRIKRVKINSRIVREEQLLWLEEINRDPDNALLWSEVITLKQPFFMQRWIRDRHLKPAGPIFKDITEPEPSQSSLPSKLIGGISLAALLLGALWLFREDIGVSPSADTSAADASGAEIQGADAVEPNTLVGASDESASGSASGSASESTSNESATGDRAANTTPSTVPPQAEENAATNTTAAPTESASSTGNASDAFAQAVRVASQASADGQTASTAAEWLDLAARWQTASDLMSNIPEGNENYAIAQDRTKTYQTYSQSALQKATALQAP